MVCLDTDILIGLLREDKDAVDKIKNFENYGISLSTTPINACELFKGAFRSSYPKENSALVEEVLKNLKLLDFNLESSKLVGKLIEKLKRGGTSIGELDIMISSIVITNNEILVTRNIKHFRRIKELRLEKW